MLNEPERDAEAPGIHSSKKNWMGQRRDSGKTWKVRELWTKNFWGLLELRRYLKLWGSDDLYQPTYILLTPPTGPTGKSVQVM